MEDRVSTLRPSPYTRRVHKRDGTVRALLWIAAALTIGILLFIVGFIIFRGLVSDTTAEYPVIGSGAVDLPLPSGEGSVTVVVNAGLRVADLAADALQGILSGDTSSWGDLSGQDLDAEVFVPGDSSLPRAAVKKTLLGDAADWSPTAVVVPDAQTVLQKVATRRGGIGWVPSSTWAGPHGPSVKAVVVRSLSLIVNPAVLALQNARRLASVTQAQAEGLLSGRIANWRAVGGPDLPVRIVEDSKESREIARQVFSGAGAPPADALIVANARDLKAAVDGAEGALAVCPWSDAASVPAQILSVERREVRRNLTLAYFLEEPRRAGKVGGVSTIILNTVLMILLTLLFTTPIGVGAAIYLTEYTRQGRLVRILRFGAETLAGIPSIIFGLFGFIVFVTLLRFGIGLLSGTLTLTMMLLPTIIRTAEEAIRSAPMALREGSLALGATKWQTTVLVVVPTAVPGILTGVLLAIGRAVGETAALLFTMGTDYRLVEGLRSSARVLSVHLYYLLKEGISFDKAFATGTILVIIVLVVNLVTTRLIGRMNLMRVEGGRSGKPG